jgi:sulfur-oxidizing protein SoxZ
MAEAARWTVRVSVPPVARRGETIEVRALVGHAMETGFRHDHLGAIVPRDIITAFSCRHAGEEVFRVELTPSIAANPFFSFPARAMESGDFVFSWIDGDGRAQEARAPIVVA